MCTDLAPLTTVGNLVSAQAHPELRKGDLDIRLNRTQPFRRLCVSLGADITCGESKPLDIQHNLDFTASPC